MKRVDRIERAFLDAWPRAQAAFSPYTRLLPPILCRTKKDEKREGLDQSFAMIRMRDERIVIGLTRIAERDLDAHAHAILAHEVGHYVHAPGTLREHVRLHDRIRRTLAPAFAAHAGLVANLYTDLLLNDRLQRGGLADIAAVYAALRQDEVSTLWALYMRTYERLWGLPTGKLVPPPDATIQADAELAARVVRHFRDRWLEGAPSFTLLVEPYLPQLEKQKCVVPPWLDTAGTSVGDAVPDGLTDDDFDPSAVLHPAVDGALEPGAGEAKPEEAKAPEKPGAPGAAQQGDGRPDRRRPTRGPKEWLDLMRAVGVTRSPKELLVQYYRELARPHLIPFPTRVAARSTDPMPEGVDLWEPSSGFERVAWFESLARSPVPIPGVTMLERVMGEAEGAEPERRAPDLYIGIDCSGSMGNPAHQLAYPVVAGVVLALSALRAGARVMVCLSGEWHGDGRFVETAGFVRDEVKILGVLTDYLGTGASFGLPRLVRTFVEKPAPKRPVHVLVISDSDLFGEIDGTVDGWAHAKRALDRAGGGGTAVLRLGGMAGSVAQEYYGTHFKNLRDAGLEPHTVATEQELVTFARAFARRTFGDP